MISFCFNKEFIQRIKTIRMEGNFQFRAYVIVVPSTMKHTQMWTYLIYLFVFRSPLLIIWYTYLFFRSPLLITNVRILFKGAKIMYIGSHCTEPYLRHIFKNLTFVSIIETESTVRSIIYNQFTFSAFMLKSISVCFSKRCWKRTPKFYTLSIYFDSYSYRISIAGDSS